jgi:drug/metabolite transporter (DMT)-like permease
LFVPAGVAGITFYTFPVYVYALSVTLLDEQLSARKVGALVLALSGVFLIVAGDGTGVDVAGIRLVLLAAFGNACYITGSRAALASIEAGVLAGTALTGTAVSFLGFGLVSGRLFVPAGVDQWLVVLGILLLGEVLTPAVAVGSGLVLSGVVVIQTDRVVRDSVPPYCLSFCVSARETADTTTRC